MDGTGAGATGVVVNAAAAGVAVVGVVDVDDARLVVS